MTADKLTVQITVKHKWMLYCAAYLQFFTNAVCERLLRWSMRVV